MTLYSPEHIEKQKQLHQELPAYGQTSMVFAPMVSELVNANDIAELLDYGSGQGEVGKRLELNHEVTIRNYDPAISDYCEAPDPAEMLICLDVLDAVEDEYIEPILDDLARLTKKMAFVSVNTSAPPAENEMVDGRNFKPVEWWLPRIMERFELHYFSRIDYGFVVVLRSANKQ